ncbi:MAG: glycosyltransferase family 1 protein [Fibrobacterota bacterium]
MRIGFDAKRVFFNKTGLGNYGRSLLSALFMRHPNEDYLLYTPRKPSGVFPDFEAEALNHAEVRAPEFLPARLFPALWRSFGIGRTLSRDNVSVYHGLSMEIPTGLRKRGIRSAVCIHDLIFLKHPEFYPVIDRQIYNAKFIHACRNADCIVALSEQTRQDILNGFQLPPERVRVIHPTCDPAFTRVADEGEKAAVRERFHLTQRFILYVGTVNARKNLMTLVRAFKRLGMRGVSLVAVGSGGGYRRGVQNYVASNGLSDRVFFLDRVSTADLPALYQQAEVFAYPSFYEGFGLPILEALHSRVPVVTTRGGCFPEAGGPGSLYVDPLNVDEMAHALRRALTEPALRESMITTGLNHAQPFTPDAFADKAWNMYREIAEGTA